MLETATQIADHAARQSDRWLFIATLVLMMISMLALARWFLADRKGLADRLTTMTDRHITQSEDLSKVVTNNTAALNEISKKLQELERNCGYNIDQRKHP